MCQILSGLAILRKLRPKSPPSHTRLEAPSPGCGLVGRPPGWPPPTKRASGEGLGVPPGFPQTTRSTPPPHTSPCSPRREGETTRGDGSLSGPTSWAFRFLFQTGGREVHQVRNESHLSLARPPGSHPPHCARKHPSRPFPLRTVSLPVFRVLFLTKMGSRPADFTASIWDATETPTALPREGSSGHASGAAPSHSRRGPTLMSPPTEGRGRRSGRLGVANRAGVCTLAPRLVHAWVRPMAVARPDVPRTGPGAQTSARQTLPAGRRGQRARVLGTVVDTAKRTFQKLPEWCPHQ